MNRSYHTFPVNEIQDIKQRMLNWVNRFNICCFLDNHNYDLPYSKYECLAGAGAIKDFRPNVDFFHSLNTFTRSANDWIFGHFNYDCKNYIEALTSQNFDGIDFPDAFLFVPQVVLLLTPAGLVIGTTGKKEAEEVFKQILSAGLEVSSLEPVVLRPRISHSNYIATVEKLKEHLKRGDCYEINFCQEFYQEAVQVDTIQLFSELGQQSPNPFSAYYKLDDKTLACASPERFVQKKGDIIISQPVKGTAARDHVDAGKDERNKLRLKQSQKEQSENVMIVDLVRNDLSKFCKEGSVYVKELMEVYSFPNVHQMVSTVAGTVDNKLKLADVLQATFPMGSMTGAPKKRVMELIEQYEHTKRGIYSGSVGYITPKQDFDFNVVIRSIMYNVSSQYLSYQVGGAITHLSDPQQEYEECLLKAEAMQKVLSGNKKRLPK